MQDFGQKDPFTQVLEYTEKAFVDHGFKVASWNENKAGPLHDVDVESSMPELQFVPTGTLIRLGDTSNSTSVEKTFQIVLNTGDLRLGRVLLPNEWKLLKLMHKLKYDEAFEFVHSYEVASASSGRSDPSKNRNIQGWVALWDVTVLMSFAKADLQLES